jgi:hypothetical protein
MDLMKIKTASVELFKPALATTFAIVIACAISVQSAQAGYIVTLQEVGSNVVAKGSGPIDLTALSLIGTGGGIERPSITAQAAFIFTGKRASADGYRVVGGDITGPSNFGTGSLTFPNSSSGDIVGLFGPPGGVVFVPHGYTSNSALSDTSIYRGATLASLGVTPGTYEWTWGTGANQNFTLETLAPTTAPDTGSTLGLLAFALAGLFGASRLRSIRAA